MMKPNRIIVVSPHPDDETLGCGGTLLRHHGMGCEIHWLIMTTITEQAAFSTERVTSRKQEINMVACLTEIMVGCKFK